MTYKIYPNERILIAGANGMAGSAICRSLLRRGYGEPKEDGSLLTPTRKDLNLLDSNAVDQWFKEHQPSVVVIAAAKVGGILANASQPTEFLLENLKIQNNLIEAAWKSNVKRLLFLGSSCIYPKDAKQPIKEEYLLNGSLEKTNESYALAKISGIKLCEALFKQHSFDAICLMPTNLYGPGDNYNSYSSHVMAALIKRFSEAKKKSQKKVKCWGTGNPLREFLYVDDLGDAVVFCLEKWDPKSEKAPKQSNGSPLLYLNVGTGKDISIKNLAEKISEIYQYDGIIEWDNSKPDGTYRKLLNTKKINEMGWESKTKLDEGLKKTITNYENNRRIPK
jgi:GDP-L-fucose synthase